MQKWFLRGVCVPVCIVVVCIWIAGCGPGSRAVSAGEIRALLPNGTVQADILDLVGSPRLNELMARFQQAAGRDPQRFRELVRNARPGEPLPYDPAVGMTEAEYSEFQRLLHEIQLQKVAEAPLTFKTREGDWRQIETNAPALSDFNNLLINPTGKKVRTPFGNASAPAHVEPSEGQKAGRWRGVCWNESSGNLSTGDAQTLEVCVGRMVGDESRGILHYSAKIAVGGKILSQVERIVTYPLSR